MSLCKKKRKPADDGQIYWLADGCFCWGAFQVTAFLGLPFFAHRSLFRPLGWWVVLVGVGVCASSGAGAFGMMEDLPGASEWIFFLPFGASPPEDHPKTRITRYNNGMPLTPLAGRFYYAPQSNPSLYVLAYAPICSFLLSHTPCPPPSHTLPACHARQTIEKLTFHEFSGCRQ